MQKLIIGFETALIITISSQDFAIRVAMLFCCTELNRWQVAIKNKNHLLHRIQGRVKILASLLLIFLLHIHIVIFLFTRCHQVSNILGMHFFKKLCTCSMKKREDSRASHKNMFCLFQKRKKRRDTLLLRWHVNARRRLVSIIIKFIVVWIIMGR